MTSTTGEPLVILRKPGADDGESAARVVDLVACNDKSRTKTLERGELWIVDPETGRVLPYRGGGVTAGAFIPTAGIWEVTVSGRIPEPAAAPAGAESPEAVPHDRARPAGAARHPSGPTGPTGAGGEVTDPTTVIADLGDLIAERRRTMPEGSYTTHLFNKGPEKIRKKAGEEAVELILATQQEELRSEAADLIYHLMVLLEVEGLRLEDVIATLAARHRSG